MSKYSRIIAGFVVLFSATTTSTNAVEIPKPVINVPRPAVTVNVPKPVVNVPKPAVTVNVPKPAPGATVSDNVGGTVPVGVLTAGCAV